ncbi:hypothetical protein [Nonomuraea sp. NPDC001831]|uniref:hypothetical protein n=1 Tax=Nonomuraea sp. NPDC001831 TaxID=3364340 RepID=UPI0036B4D143
MTDRSRPPAGDVRWAFGCAFPAVSAGSAVLSLPVQLLARLPWAAGRRWPQLLSAVLALAVTVAGPVALTLYDLAVQGTPGDCVLPWWPAWLPS